MDVYLYFKVFILNLNRIIKNVKNLNLNVLFDFSPQIKLWLADSAPVVIGYFCSLSINATPKHLLSSLCSQVAFRYSEVQSSSKTVPRFVPCRGPDDPSCSSVSVLEHPLDENLNFSVMKGKSCLSDSKECLESLLSMFSSTTRPLILLLDGLDQLEDDGGAQIIRSFPSPLPDGVKLILTVSTRSTRLLQVVELYYSEKSHMRESESAYVHVRLESVDRKRCVKLLESLLKGSGRRVTSGQQALVNQALTSCCLPLYARLLHAHTSLWHSGMMDHFFNLGANKCLLNQQSTMRWLRKIFRFRAESLEAHADVHVN